MVRAGSASEEWDDAADACEALPKAGRRNSSSETRRRVCITLKGSRVPP